MYSDMARLIAQAFDNRKCVVGSFAFGDNVRLGTQDLTISRGIRYIRGTKLALLLIYDVRVYVCVSGRIVAPKLID